MPVLPTSEIALIQFCEQHQPVWAAAPASVGVSASACATMLTQTKAARDAFTAALNARNASKAATTTLHSNVRTVRDTVSDMIKTIKAFAANASNPLTVYAAAQIDPPAPPAPPAKPGMPEMITVNLNPGGSLTLKWKAKNGSLSSGAVYNVTRRIGSGGNYVGVGSAQGGPRQQFEFTDSNLPFGTSQASYIMQGVRGLQTGTPSEAVTLQFGVGGDGAIVTSNNATLKMAA